MENKQPKLGVGVYDTKFYHIHEETADTFKVSKVFDHDLFVDTPRWTPKVFMPKVFMRLATPMDLIESNVVFDAAR